MKKTPVALAACTFAIFVSAAHAEPFFGPAFLASTEVTDMIGPAPHRPSLNDVVRNWDAYGFIPPVKPAQAVVNGRNGASISGAEYAAAVAILRSGRVTGEGRSAAVGVRPGRR